MGASCPIRGTRDPAGYSGHIRRGKGRFAAPDAEVTVEERGRDWVVLAGVALMLTGILRFFDALWAFVLPTKVKDAVISQSVTTHGWIYLVVAIVLFCSGLSIMVRSQFARWIGIMGGAIGGISAVWWMPYHPVWSLAFVGVCIFVIYSLVTHWERESVL
jgi:hypothetical protein